MLINMYAGSGGDALPWMFRRLGSGPLIGTRTWGGLIGIGGYPTLIDGGLISAPRWAAYNPDTGQFDVENRGVAVALDLLKQHPAPQPKRPPYPIYDWKRVRQAVATRAVEPSPATPPVAPSKSDH